MGEHDALRVTGASRGILNERDCVRVLDCGNMTGFADASIRAAMTTCRLSTRLPSKPASCRPSSIAISMQAPALRRIPV